MTPPDPSIGRTFATVLGLLLVLAVGSSLNAQINGAFNVFGRQKALMQIGDQLDEVDLSSGVVQTIGTCNLYAVDASSRTVLILRRQGSGTAISTRSLDKLLAPSKCSLIRLAVFGVTWAGTANKYFISATPMTVQQKDIPFSVYLTLNLNPKDSYFTSPIPGVSQAPPARHPLFNPVLAGCVAYSSEIDNPEVVLRDLKAQQPIGSGAYLVVLKDWRPWRVWPVPSPASGAPLAFSKDGTHLVARLSSWTRPVKCIDVDLTSGKEIDATWLSPNVETIAMSGDLKQALVLVERPKAGSAVVDDVEPIIESLEKQDGSGADHGRSQTTWMLATIQAGRNPILITTFTDEPSLAVTRVGESRFLVSDGKSLWTIGDGRIAKHIVLKFVK